MYLYSMYSRDSFTSTTCLGRPRPRSRISLAKASTSSGSSSGRASKMSMSFLATLGVASSNLMRAWRVGLSTREPTVLPARNRPCSSRWDGGEFSAGSFDASCFCPARSSWQAFRTWQAWFRYAVLQILLKAGSWQADRLGSPGLREATGHQL